MKYIKTYENIYENNIKLRDKYCWIIYGSAETILNVYEKLEHQSSHFCDTAIYYPTIFIA